MCCSACQPIAEASSASLKDGNSIILVETTDSGKLNLTSLRGSLLSAITDSIKSTNFCIKASSLGIEIPSGLKTSTNLSTSIFFPGLPLMALIV